ncbi:MAG: deoxyribose-phosphate aldolase [Actinomycetota bacterium]
MREDLELVLRCLDLTWLALDATPAQIRSLCTVAIHPGANLPHVAAVCVLEPFVPMASELVHGSGVRVACATAGFPSGVATTQVRRQEIEAALAAGATEIDTVLDHAAVLEGKEPEVLDGLLATREACGGAVMKVILETGAYPLLPFVRRAAEIAIEAGADFVKTSTGVGFPGATPEAVIAMMESTSAGDRPVGIKVSGGVKSAADALGYLDLVTRALGDAWRSPERFRIGASGLVRELVTALGEAG